MALGVSQLAAFAQRLERLFKRNLVGILQ